MTERERWIVYPLLFLSLGASLRDKLFDQTMSRRIVCQELTVVGDDSGGREPVRVLARIGASEPVDGAPPSGQLYIDGQLFVDGIRAGTVMANNYVYQGVPFSPTVRNRLPGMSPADLLRALQESAQTWSATDEPDAAPPDNAAEGDE